MAKNFVLRNLRRYLPANTVNFLSKTLTEKQNRLEKLKGNHDETQLLTTEISNIEKILGHFRPHTPSEQKEKISLGNGVVLDVNGEKKTLFVDSVLVGKKRSIVSLNSPWGQVIFGKKVGQKGTITVEKKELRFKVLEIWPYTKAKRIIFKGESITTTSIN